MTYPPDQYGLDCAMRRALNDFKTFPGYRGGAADPDALIALEDLGLLRSLERAADKPPVYYLTAKGLAFTG